MPPWLPCRHGEGYAGRAETSLLLHLDPARVDLARAVPRPSRCANCCPVCAPKGVRAVVPNGIPGRPDGVSVAEGEALLRRMADEIVAALGAR